MRGTAPPLRLLGHEADRPHPAGELARRGHVRLVAVDPAREQRLPPLDQPPHALGGMPAGDPVRGLALGEVLRPPRARQVVPRGRDQRLPQVLVACLGDRAPAVALPAGVLGGRQADPCGERPGVPEPRELAGLEHEVGGRRGVDALEAAQGVDPPPPPGLAGLGLDEPLEPRLLLRRPPDRVDLVGEHVVVGPLREPYRLDPGPVRPGPVALPAAGGRPLVEGEPVPEQELGEPLLRAREVVPRVLERPGQVAGGLALVVGDPHLDHVADRQHAGEELGVVAVVLPAPVRAGLDHLRDGADHAVDPQAGKPLLQVEARDPGLVHAPGLWVHGPHPLRDCPGVVAEGRAAHLPGHDVEGDCLYRAGVDVEADEGGSIEHGSPFHECGVAAAAELDTHHCRPNPRSFMQQGLSMFLCPAHIVCNRNRYDSASVPAFQRLQYKRKTAGCRRVWRVSRAR